jgi:hypothetical protein
MFCYNQYIATPQDVQTNTQPICTYNYTCAYLFWLCSLNFMLPAYLPNFVKFARTAGLSAGLLNTLFFNIDHLLFLCLPNLIFPLSKSIQHSSPILIQSSPQLLLFIKDKKFYYRRPNEWDCWVRHKLTINRLTSLRPMTPSSHHLFS